jgi:two-component system, NtrC family, sensor histidine kinase KinB
MAYSVRQKIRYGTIFLFLLLMILGAVSIFHIVRLQEDSRSVLTDNYESLEYGYEMLSALDSNTLNSDNVNTAFETALAKQENNVTEPSEMTITESVRHIYDKGKQGNISPEMMAELRMQVLQLLKINMSAIKTKNENATITAQKAVMYITVIAGLILVVSVSFSYNFPSVITEPIDVLTKGISEIASKNYGHRIHLDRKDEFGKMAGSFNSMAERLEFFENSNLNQILFEKSRAEAVINSLKDASIGIDASNRILFANRQALTLLGLQSGQLLGKQSDEVSKVNELFHFLVEDRNNMPFKVVVDNREHYFVKEVMDITGDNANGIVIIAKNITSFKELDVAKNNFIATISHELKTPLASSDFSLKLLKDTRVGQLTQEQHELIENLQRDNHRMLRILSELLNIAQVESGRIQLELQEVLPADIVDNAIEVVHNVAKENDITIEKSFEDNIPQISADGEKTSWVLNNLLTNALKYSRPGDRVLVSVWRSEHEVYFSVADNGPGIPPEYHAKIFDRFFKVPGSRPSGTGLGLAISKEFVEAQAGRIWLETRGDAGCTFVFCLPTPEKRS